jgi:haloalkane dehalogenase
VDETYRRWLNRVEYPFALREFDSGEGWMNYIDEGEGHAVVFVHGCMTWSFLFRRTVEALSATYRCIVPDHLGFGLSEKPQTAGYLPEDHVRRFEKFMASLGLDEVTLVVHDFGAPIALKWAAENPDQVRNIVILNSYLWDMQENPLAAKLALNYGHPLNQFYYRHIRATPSFVLPPLFADRYRVARPILRQYLHPFETHRDRIGLFSTVEGYRRDGDWFNAVGETVASLSDKRTLIIWGLKDPLHTEESLARMQQLFPEAQTVTFADTGRLLPEEKPEALTGELTWFLMNSELPGMSLVDQLGG